MYPSDMYYVYGNGFDNNCFINPKSGVFPITGWILRSNVQDEDGLSLSYARYIWFISSGISNWGYVFDANGYGNLDGENSFGGNWSGIRTVLYLSSQVKIIDGNGSQNNPYKLSI